MWSKEAKHRTRTYTGVTMEQVASLLEQHLTDTKATIHNIEKDDEGISFDGRRSMTWTTNFLAFHVLIHKRGDSIVVVLDAKDSSLLNTSAQIYVGKIFKRVDGDVTKLGGTVEGGMSDNAPSGAS